MKTVAGGVDNLLIAILHPKTELPIGNYCARENVYKSHRLHFNIPVIYVNFNHENTPFSIFIPDFSCLYCKSTGQMAENRLPG